VKPFWLLSFWSICEASNAFLAWAIFLAFSRCTRVLQYGQVRVFWVFAARSKPPQRVHTMIEVGFMGCVSERLFHVRLDNV
jgi:hypothetical protein